MRKLPPNMRSAPFVEDLGIKFPKLESGYCMVKAKVTENMLNNYGTVHGGALFTIADACSGAAAFFALGENELCRTIELKINYFKPVRSGELICEAKLANKSSNLATVEAEITNNSQLIAKTLGTYFIQEIDPAKDGTKEKP